MEWPGATEDWSPTEEWLNVPEEEEPEGKEVWFLAIHGHETLVAPTIIKLAKFLQTPRVRNAIKEKGGYLTLQTVPLGENRVSDEAG